MTRQINSVEISSSFWDSTPIGQSIELCLCKYDQLFPQLILEDKIFRLLINSKDYSKLQFIGTLVSDDESKCLTYVIDRLIETNDIHNHQLLTEEFLIPIQYENKNSTIQDGMKEIEMYFHSSLPIELHRFLYLCGQISLSKNIVLSFDLLTIKNRFILTPINSNSIQIIPTNLLKTVKKNKIIFGYCSLDRISKNKILFIPENDSRSCTLPLIGIWVYGIVDIQSSFIWSICLRYCLNSSLKQRFRSGINPQQSFLLACYSPTSYSQWNFYEVYSTSLMSIEYDLWTCSKQILIQNLNETQFPYDFQFQRVYNPLTISPNDHHHHQVALLSPNTNGSLFGIPRSPPKQSLHQTPSWDSMIIPKQLTTILPSDTQWKEELIERMQSYETHIQSLTTLVSQLLTTQQTSIKESIKHDVAVQSEPSLLMIKNNQQSFQSLTPTVIHEQESSIHQLTSSTDLNTVDILRPIFQFIDKQQQGSISSLITKNNSTDTTLLQENDSQNENMFHLANVTSTTTTGISLISNGIQMQFINKQSSTTTVYPQSQSVPSSTELVVSPQKSENNLSIEVHGLEMKYLEDDQLAVAIEYHKPSQTPEIVDKSLSFGTEEYLQRYGLLTDSNS